MPSQSTSHPQFIALIFLFIYLFGTLFCSLC